MWSQLSVVSGRSHEYHYRWATSPGTVVGVDISESMVDFVTHIACGGGREKRGPGTAALKLICFAHPAQRGHPDAWI